MRGLSLVVSSGLYHLLLLFCLSWFSPGGALASTGVVDIVARVPGCGDGVLDSGEECDLADFDGKSCQILGFDSGSLSCTSACFISTNACVINPVAPESSQRMSSSNTMGYIVITGRAYPNNQVFILKDGNFITSVVTDTNGFFQSSIAGLSKGDYKFSFVAKDSSGQLSRIVSFDTDVRSGLVAKVFNVSLPPTINLSQKSISLGQSVVVSGYTEPQAMIRISIVPETGSAFFVDVLANDDGYYGANISTQSIEGGATLFAAILENGKLGESSFFEKIIVSDVQSVDVTVSDLVCSRTADLNGDCKVNLFDFAIASFWFQRPLSISMLELEKTRLTGDKNLDLHDFSLMAYYWTG